MLIRTRTACDADVIRAITTAAFAPRQPPGPTPPKAALIYVLPRRPRLAPGPVPGLGHPRGGEVIGHVLGTRGYACPTPCSSPSARWPSWLDRQRHGVGSALMHAVLGAADALGEPLAALLGDPAYYRRFAFEPSTAYQITPPRPQWQPHFQVRVLSGYQPRLRGMFTYPEPFDRT